MSWRCRRVRTQLALLVGDDLPDRERRTVDSHLTQCESCRCYLLDLERSRDVLRDVRGEDCMPRSSLWPAVREQIAASVPAPRNQSWLPIGAMVAASIAITVVVWNRAAAVLPPAPIQMLDQSSWLPPGIRTIETSHESRPIGALHLPNQATPVSPSPVRSYYLLESGSPNIGMEEEL